MKQGTQNAYEAGSHVETFAVLSNRNGAQEPSADFTGANPLHALMSAAHDLQSPIAGILEKVRTLLVSPAPHLGAAQKKELLEIERLCGHMRSMIDECYNFGLLEFGDAELSPEVNDLGACIQQLHAIWAVSARQKKIVLNFNGDPTGPVFAFDNSKIQRVLSNLIDNALKYTPSGGTVTLEWEKCFFERRVRVESRSGPERRRRPVDQPNAVRISVTDSGGGIAPQDQQEIFEPFVRAANKSHRGMGLGLSIARKFVNWHGGRIWVESTLGQGSKFCVTLPLRQWNGDRG